MRRAHDGIVSCVEWYPFDTGMFVTGGSDKCVKIWDTESMQCVLRWVLNGEAHAITMNKDPAFHNIVASMHCMVVMMVIIFQLLVETTASLSVI